MKINAINYSFSFGKPTEQKVNFQGKRNSNGIIYGMNYDELTADDFTRGVTIPEIKEMKKADEDISEYRKKLILSRIPAVLEDAEEFCSKHPQFDFDDISQSLILLMVKRTDTGLRNFKDDYNDGSNYSSSRDWYLNKLLRTDAFENNEMIKQFLEIQEEEREVPPIYQDIEDEIVKEEVDKVLHTLTPRQEQVARLCFRIGKEGEGEEKTQKQIAEEIGVFPTRISECKKQIVKNLRKSKHCNKLKDLYE